MVYGIMLGLCYGVDTTSKLLLHHSFETPHAVLLGDAKWHGLPARYASLSVETLTNYLHDALTAFCCSN